MKRIIRDTTIADRLLFLLLMTVSVTGIFISREAVSQARDVTVELNGKPLYTFPLTADRTVAVNGPYGQTVIEIESGKVRVKEAHCPNLLCVKQGWISRGAIVCLPNRLVIFVGGEGKDNDKTDAVTG